jgi:hypothetical protein
MRHRTDAPSVSAYLLGVGFHDHPATSLAGHSNVVHTQPLNRLGFLLMLVITLIHTKITRMGDVAPSLFLQNPLQ